MPFALNTGITPTAAIEKLEKNDPTFTECSLAKNTLMQMKGMEYLPKLAAALKKNTVCKELSLADCNIGDQMCSELAAALAVNQTLVTLSLEDNKVGNEGATQFAKALASNRSLLQLNMMGQKGQRFGDATLHAFTDMFDTNVTLLKIIWRLESRQSFRLTKMLTRNNDIDRRIKAGKEYADLLPPNAQALDPALVAQRAAASALLGTTPRQSQASQDSGSLSNSERRSGSERQDETVSPSRPKAASESVTAAPPKPPAAPQPPPPAAPPGLLEAPDPELEAKLTALEVEYEEAATTLKAQFAERKAAVIAEHHAD